MPVSYTHLDVYKRQSLARAVLAQPDIFIMDEATSSVDTLTESLIQKGMDALMQDCTSSSASIRSPKAVPCAQPEVLSLIHI